MSFDHRSLPKTTGPALQGGGANAVGKRTLVEALATQHRSTTEPKPEPRPKPEPGPKPETEAAEAASAGDHSAGAAPAQHGDTSAGAEAHEQGVQDEQEAPAVEPAKAFEIAVSGSPSPLPYRQQLSTELGMNLDGVEAHVGTPEAQIGLVMMGAEAATVGRKVAFIQAQPSLETVRHEAIHLKQASAGGDHAPQALSSPQQATEQEAAAGAQSSA